MISVTISSPETLYVYYTRMPSPIYQYVVNQEKSRSTYECFGAGTSCSYELDFWIRPLAIVLRYGDRYKMVSTERVKVGLVL